MVQSTQRRRIATPDRWERAALRAIDEGIEVRQVNANGMWVANSGTQANVAYMLEVNQGIVQSCTCPAGTHGDPCCKHAARFYLDAGILDVGEPVSPAAAVSPDCPICHGCGVIYDRTIERAGMPYPTCQHCNGTGISSEADRAA